jgi:hypothetical protein
MKTSMNFIPSEVINIIINYARSYIQILNGKYILDMRNHASLFMDIKHQIQSDTNVDTDVNADFKKYNVL